MKDGRQQDGILQTLHPRQHQAVHTQDAKDESEKLFNSS
jgi:hypothetical protein